eukprot:TRINITY_DN16027_c0_g1_i3.p1 TRINITY_DN16027_c0_g1~~TRINITY_DN16027_c0_g1_i3.p1  ORF type:complete len:837 (+),score=118.44 TRINITY_DN16027_c0_g1_i3:118-2628(+)
MDLPPRDGPMAPADDLMLSGSMGSLSALQDQIGAAFANLGASASDGLDLALDRPEGAVAPARYASASASPSVGLAPAAGTVTGDISAERKEVAQPAPAIDLEMSSRTATDAEKSATAASRAAAPMQEESDHSPMTKEPSNAGAAALAVADDAPVPAQASSASVLPAAASDVSPAPAGTSPHSGSASPAAAGGGPPPSAPLPVSEQAANAVNGDAPVRAPAVAAGFPKVAFEPMFPGHRVSSQPPPGRNNLQEPLLPPAPEYRPRSQNSAAPAAGQFAPPQEQTPSLPQTPPPVAAAPANVPRGEAAASQPAPSPAPAQVLPAVSPERPESRPAAKARGVSPETQTLLDSLRETRETMWSLANPLGRPAPNAGFGMPPANFPAGMAMQQAAGFPPQVPVAMPPHVANPWAAPQPGWPWPAQGFQPAGQPPMPHPVPQQMIPQQAVPQAVGSTCPLPPQTPPAQPVAAAEPLQRPPSSSVAIQAEVPPQQPTAALGQQQGDFHCLGDPTLLRREFDAFLKHIRFSIYPELRAKREDLANAVQGIDGRVGELRRRAAEAEREGREEFEALRSHLSSVESLKRAVLSREREVRASLIEEIDGLVDNLKKVDAGGLGYEGMAAFLRNAGEVTNKAESLWSRATSLPSVEVPIDDLPYEARVRTEKLRQLVVLKQLQQAKDVAIWRLESQRRELAAEAVRTQSWLLQLEHVLDRYGEEMAHSCYFCAESFSAAAANMRCPHNTGLSPRSGCALVADPRVPAHLWGTGLHFWLPRPQAPSPSAPHPPSPSPFSRGAWPGNLPRGSDAHYFPRGGDAHMPSGHCLFPCCCLESFPSASAQYPPP